MNLNKFAGNSYQFFKQTLWTMPIEKMNWFKRLFFKQLRIIVFAGRGFIKDKCPLHASALTYYSLLSLVPFAALVFSISKGFGMQDALRKKLITELPEHKEIIDWILTFAKSLLQTESSGLITGIGIVLLIWAAIRLLGNIEETLNNIWSVNRARSLTRKFSDYLSIMIIGPLFFLISSSIAVFIKSQVTVFARQTEIIDTMNPFVAFAFNLIPYSLIWLLFLLTYMIIPNIKVNWKAALYGALFAGTLYHWAQWFYITFQLSTSKYSAVYGSFAAFPLFLIWLQISWFIVLLGAELSYAFQNIPSYVFEKKSGRINHFYKKVLSLDIMNGIIKNFQNGERPHSTKQIATKTQIPENIAGEILTDLQTAGMISRVSKGKRSHAFQPARDINTIKIQDVLLALEYEGDDNKPLVGEYFRADIVARLKKFDVLLKKNSQNILVKDI